MLARLQQISTLFLIGAAIAWMVYALRIDRPGMAVIGAAVILCGHAAILGIEFALMQSANRDDSFPVAKPRDVLTAWLAETWRAPLVFCWRQPFRENAFADRLRSAVPRRGLVLAHGFVCNRGLWNAWYPRLIERDIPFVGVNFEPVFGDIDDYAAELDAAIASLQESTGMPPVVVAHSMGGLVVRAWLRHAGTGAVDRVHHVITLGTPHGGTALARLGFSSNTRQMTRAGTWLGELFRSEAVAITDRFTCVFSNCDNIVFPTTTAVLPTARTVHIPACAHVQMVDHPQSFAEVLLWLEMTQMPENATPVAGHSPIR